MGLISRGFEDRDRSMQIRARSRRPVRHPGPRLSAGPNRTRLFDRCGAAIGGQAIGLASGPGTSCMALPSEDVTVDIHCVTKWTKLDTRWRGVSVDTLLEDSESRPRTWSSIS